MSEDILLHKNIFVSFCEKLNRCFCWRQNIYQNQRQTFTVWCLMLYSPAVACSYVLLQSENAFTITTFGQSLHSFSLVVIKPITDNLLITLIIKSASSVSCTYIMLSNSDWTLCSCAMGKTKKPSSDELWTVGGDDSLIYATMLPVQFIISHFHLTSDHI